MITEDVIQGSDEWKKFRIGIPTASNFSKIITSKGEPSKQAQKYMYQLAGERVSGIREESYQNANMERGIQMEAEAIEFYELVTGSKVLPCGIGFCDEKRLYAASPDGLVGDDGCVEIKCPIMSTHVEYLLDNKLPTEYFQQVMEQLLVTGRKWVDFVSYYGGLRPLIIRVERNEVFIESLRSELQKFCIELDKITEQIRA